MKKYIVKLESNTLSNFVRTFDTYQEGLNAYNALKTQFIGLNCTLVFLKEMIINEEKVETVYWKKSLRNEKDCEHHLNNIRESIEAIKMIREDLGKKMSESDTFINNLYHLLELEDIENLSADEKNTILENTQILAVKRRMEKIEYSQLQAIAPSIGTLNKVCNTMKEKIENNKKSWNTKQLEKKVMNTKTHKYDKLLNKIL